MKKALTTFLLTSLLTGMALAQDGIRFRLLRQQDSVAGYAAIQAPGAYQKAKYIPLGPKSRLSFGGSLRLQAESFTNETFRDVADQDRVWYLNRLMLHSHLLVGKKWEVFAELTSSIPAGKQEVSPVDKDELHVNQLFLRYTLRPQWQIEVGRLNMRLGAGRLVDIREGPNVRRSFDRIALKYQSEPFTAQAFFSAPVQNRPGVFDNRALDFAETFSGLYTEWQATPKTRLDLYLLYQKQDQVTYQAGTANERRYSAGVRQEAVYGDFSVNNEAVYQFGRFGGQDISAWTLSFQLEYRTAIAAQDINLGLKTEAISGDKATDDNTLNTFDALYPRGAYFGRVARFGPSNLLDIHPYINTEVGKFFFELDYDAFWRYSLADGLYNPALLLEYRDLNDRRFIAHQFGTLISFAQSRHLALEWETNLILPGPFLTQSNLPATLFHTVLTMELRF